MTWLWFTMEPLAPVVTIKLNVLTGKGTARPFGKHVLIMSEAIGFSFDCMYESRDLALTFPSLDRRSF